MYRDTQVYAIAEVHYVLDDVMRFGDGMIANDGDVISEYNELADSCNCCYPLRQRT